MSDFASSPFAVEIAVDDCWNRIGVRGDNSCVKLKEYFRCLNCPTFASAASALLDRPVFGGDDGANLFSPAGEDEGEGKGGREARGRGDATASMLAFRVGAEWLAFPTAAVVEVIEARAVHSLPSQANPAVLGLTNIRGALKICVSLARMLGMADAPSARTAQRLLVVEHEQQVLVFPVDEVAGVYGYAANAVQPPPSTMTHAGMTYTQSLIAWRDRQLGLLDCGLLFYALNRSLT